MPSRGQVMSVAEASRRSGVSVAMLRYWCRQGRIGQKLGREWVITEADLRTVAALPRRRRGD